MSRIGSIVQALRDRMTLRADSGSIELGLIGVGGWGASNAVSIMRSKRFKITDVYDLDEQHAQRFAARYGSRRCDQIDDLLARPDLRAVSITVPNPFHGDLVRRAADAGKHIFIEKPLASSAEECRELGGYCRERGVILQVGHQMRREAVFQRIREVIDGGELGRPLFAQGISTLDRRSRDDWRQQAEACPGGSMEQLGVHLLDVLIHVLGSPLAARGWARNIPTRSADADWGSVTLVFAADVRANVGTSFSTPQRLQLQVFCKQGWLVTDGDRLTINRGGAGAEVSRPRGPSGSVVQFEEFADCIEMNRSPQTGAAEAAVVMQAVGAIFSDEEMDLS